MAMKKKAPIHLMKVPYAVSSRFPLLFFLFFFFSFPLALHAMEVVLTDGRVLRGAMAKVSGLFETAQTADSMKQIYMIDDQLRRTFFSERLKDEERWGDTGEFESKLDLDQPVAHSGMAFKTVGPALRVQPFDEFGRRIYTMNTSRGLVNVIQGITTLTPRWTKVEGLKKVEGVNYVWDMRIATSSIPRDVLHKILLNQIDPKNAKHVMRIARFYIQAERYEKAQEMLEDLLAKFPDQPDLKGQITPMVRVIRQSSARRLLRELRLRRTAGQHRLVYELLQNFPSEGVAGDILQDVRELIQDYDAKVARRAKILKQIDRLILQISATPLRQQLREIRDEIAAELSVATVDRFATFVQNYDDAKMTAEEKLALAVSGWLLGKNDATANLSVAVSAYRVRQIILRYFNEPIKLTRERIFDELQSEEAAAPSYVAHLLAHMKPPEKPPAPVAADRPGYFRLETPGFPKQQPFVYWVQLPPEYDPYHRYPAIVALHGAGRSAEDEVTWWAGEWASSPKSKGGAEDASTTEKQAPGNPQGPNGGVAKPETADAPPPKYRAGQAARHGYIVIAPEWTEEHQRQYHYSAREHAAVLNCLRDACRRFAVDTDRVFLMGHSMGGDAAWDIGLAHPDLWAGVIPVSARAEKYCKRYWKNARYVPFYVVLGERDGSLLAENALTLDRCLRYGFNTTVVEYLGRGHEDFYDEILRIFDWMGRCRRNFYPEKFTCFTLRNWDTFFWWLEVVGLPPKSVVNPIDWPPPANAQPVGVSGKITTSANTVSVKTGTTQVTVWLSPEVIDFKRKATIKINGRRKNTKDPFIQPDLRTMLEDVRTRGDRQHPFWARFDSATGRVHGMQNEK